MDPKTQKFIEKARAVHGDKYDYSEVVYTRSVDKVKIICAKHGAFYQRPNRHLAGDGCPACGAERRAEFNTLDTATFVKMAEAVHGDRYDYSETVYEHSKKKVAIRCPQHGLFYQRPRAHLNGHGCAQCGSEATAEKRTLDTAVFIERARACHGDRYDYSQAHYVSSTTPLKIICPQHGEFLQMPNNHWRGMGCPACGVTSNAAARTSSTEEFVRKATEVHKGRYTYPDPYVNSKEKIRIICPDHGEFFQTPNAHLCGQGCPVCGGAGTSNAEREMIRAVLERFPNLTYRVNDRTLLSGDEVDLYFPDQRVAVEYNGAFWHSDERRKRSFHREKKERCVALGVELIHVYDYMWNTRREALLNMIGAKLGVFGERLGARKLLVRELTGDEGLKFFKAHHIQGGAASTCSFGLFDGDRLVSAMSFGKPRYNKDYEWELIRMCSLPGVMVQGGMGRLLRAFERAYGRPGDRICSFAQRDWSSGGAYHALGFSLVRETQEGYVWVNPRNLEWLPRYKTQKKKLEKLLGTGFNPEKTEVENMREAGYSRVWNAGCLLFEKELKP